MTEDNEQLQHRLDAYINEVSRPGIPAFSSSHVTLRYLYLDFGKELIDELLAEHWKKKHADSIR